MTRGLWDRTLWGVQFKSLYQPGEATRILGEAWCEERRDLPSLPGMPSRALLFMTRSQARAWCRARAAVYAGYPDGHSCRKWRFSAVRVRETVKVIA